MSNTVDFFSYAAETTETYTLSLHDALPIYRLAADIAFLACQACGDGGVVGGGAAQHAARRSEEHTSELQSRRDLVCRLLLEKKKVGSAYHFYRSAHEFEQIRPYRRRCHTLA